MNFYPLSLSMSQFFDQFSGETPIHSDPVKEYMVELESEAQSKHRIITLTLWVITSCLRCGSEVLKIKHTGSLNEKWMGHVCSSTPFSCSHVGSQLYIYFYIYYPYKSTNHNHTNERACACLSVTCTFGIMSEVLYILYIYSERERERERGATAITQGQGSQICRNPCFLHKITICSNPMHLLYKKIQICITVWLYHIWQNVFQLKALSSLSLALFLSLWCWGEKSVGKKYQLWHLPDHGWWCPTRSVVGSDGLLPTSVSGHITSFPTFICMWDWHFAALHYVTKDTVKKLWLVFFFFSTVLILVLNQFLPLALSWLALGCQLKKANKPARNLPVPATDWDLTRHQWNMLIAMDIPSARIPKVVLLPIRLAVA